MKLLLKWAVLFWDVYIYPDWLLSIYPDKVLLKIRTGWVWGNRIHVSVLSSFLFLVHLLLSAGCFYCSLLSLSYPVIVSAVTARSHSPPVCPLSPPQTVEHGFPHQPSALSYSPSLQLLAIGTRSGAIKLYPSLCLCVNSRQRGIWASCLNLRQAVLMNGCDAAKPSSAVHMGTWLRYFIFPRCCSTPPGIVRRRSLCRHSLSHNSAHWRGSGASRYTLPTDTETHTGFDNPDTFSQ